MEQEIRAQVELLQANLTEVDATEILSYLDYTSLKSTDNQSSIQRLCQKVDNYQTAHPEAPIPAICIYPNLVGYAKEYLKSSVHIACVSTAFPEGQTFTSIKQLETQLAIRSGADEVDMVINRGAFLQGDFEAVQDEIASIKAAVGDKHLKVILEVCDLPDAASVMDATRISIHGGADFVKTSTGKGDHGATPDSFFAMCLEVEKYAQETGKKIGLKAAGGIKTLDQAWLYRSIIVHTLGEEWLSPSLFRIGTSSLAGLAEAQAFPNATRYL